MNIFLTCIITCFHDLLILLPMVQSLIVFSFSMLLLSSVFIIIGQCRECILRFYRILVLNYYYLDKPQNIISVYFCRHLMMQHQQEQHKDKSPWIIVLQSAASATQQTTKSCSRVEMKNTAAPRPQRKKHKYEIPEQELEVALTDVFTLDPLKFRNFLGANGVSALNMACLPRKTLFEVLKRGKRNQ